MASSDALQVKKKKSSISLSLIKIEGVAHHSQSKSPKLLSVTLRDTTHTLRQQQIPRKPSRTSFLANPKRPYVCLKSTCTDMMGETLTITDYQQMCDTNWHPVVPYIQPKPKTLLQKQTQSYSTVAPPRLNSAWEDQVVRQGGKILVNLPKLKMKHYTGTVCKRSSSLDYKPFTQHRQSGSVVDSGLKKAATVDQRRVYRKLGNGKPIRIRKHFI